MGNTFGRAPKFVRLVAFCGNGWLLMYSLSSVQWCPLLQKIRTGSHNQHCPIRTGSPRPWLERWGRLWHARITGGRPPAPRPCRRRPRQAGGQAPGSASVEATRASPSGATQYLSTAVAERLGLIVHRTKDPTILFGLGYVASTPDSGPILDPVTNTVHRPCHPCSRRYK